MIYTIPSYPSYKKKSSPWENRDFIVSLCGHVPHQLWSGFVVWWLKKNKKEDVEEQIYRSVWLSICIHSEMKIQAQRFVRWWCIGGGVTLFLLPSSLFYLQHLLTLGYWPLTSFQWILWVVLLCSQTADANHPCLLSHDHEGHEIWIECLQKLIYKFLKIKNV